MNAAADLVALAWLRPLLDQRLGEAEAALIAASRQADNQADLLRCLWHLHHITAGLRSVRLQRPVLLCREMEHSLRQILLGDISSERRNLILGGLMRGLQLLPACLDAIEESGQDSGRGLSACVNDLRRWRGEAPLPPAVFFIWPLPDGCGISSGAAPDDAAISKAAGLLLAPWVQSARAVLVGNARQSAARTLGRIAHKLQQVFRGHPQERFWLGMIALCEGLSVDMFLPDEAIARILKTGALLVKQAREHGSSPLPGLDSDHFLQQMLFYFAACPVRTCYMQHLCDLFGIDDQTLADFHRPPIHRDARRAVLRSADDLLRSLMEELESDTLQRDSASCQERLQVLGLRLAALADPAMPASVLQGMRVSDSTGSWERQLVDLQLEIRRQLRWHGRRVAEAVELERQLGLLERCRPRLLTVMQQLDQQADQSTSSQASGEVPGESDDVLYKAPEAALAEMAAALGVAGRDREAGVLVLVENWLRNHRLSADTGQLRSVAFALACLEHYWSRYLADPRGADEQLVDTAFERLAYLPDIDEAAHDQPVSLADELDEADEADEDIPEMLRSVFVEECAEQLAALHALLPAWEDTAARDERLWEMRRHFHTFKGNGLAVGARRLAELGCEAQDMLDRVLESTAPIDAGLAPLLRELVAILPGLVSGDDPAVSRRLPDLVERCRRVQRGEN